MADRFDSLESMCELIVDCPHSTPKWTDEGVIVLRNQNIRNGVLDLIAPSYTNEEGYQKRIKRAVPQAGDIVFTREAPMGEVCLIPEGLKCCLGQRQVLLRPKKGISGEYLFWALQSPHVQHQISWNEGTGTTVSNVRIPVLKALKIPRHPEDEAEVAKHITAIANGIELNKQTNQTLEQMAQALFKSWFVDFDPVIDNVLATGGDIPEALQHKAEQRAIYKEKAQQLPDFKPLPDDIRALFPSEFEQTDEPNIGIAGWIPKGWKTPYLYDLGDFINGAAYKKFEPNQNGEGLPIIKIAELKSGITANTGFSTVNMPEKYLLADKDILFSWSGNPDTSIDTFVWSNGEAWLNQHIFKVIPNHECSYSYLLSLLKYLKPEFSAIARDKQTTGLGHVTVKDLKNLAVNLPHAELIEAFDKQVMPIFERIFLNKKNTNELEKTRHILLPKLISGEITINKEVA